MPDEPSQSRDFSGFYRATVAPLRRYLARMTGSQAEAQDLAHDAYVRVYPVFRDREVENRQAFLYTTARRLAFSRLRRQKGGPIDVHTPLEHEPSSTAPGVPQVVMARQELAQLQWAIARLPEGCREVLLLRKMELLSHEEIGRRLGISISTVEKQHARALRLLRAAMAAPQDEVAKPEAVKEVRA